MSFTPDELRILAKIPFHQISIKAVQQAIPTATRSDIADAIIDKAIPDPPLHELEVALGFESIANRRAERQSERLILAISALHEGLMLLRGVVQTLNDRLERLTQPLEAAKPVVDNGPVTARPAHPIHAVPPRTKK